MTKGFHSQMGYFHCGDNSSLYFNSKRKLCNYFVNIILEANFKVLFTSSTSFTVILTVIRSLLHVAGDLLSVAYVYFSLLTEGETIGYANHF